MTYRINEGRLNVLHDRSIHVLTLEPWGHGEPLNLTISRGAKPAQETLKESVARQVQNMSGQLEGFQWQDVPPFESPTTRLRYEMGRCTYRLAEVPVYQCMAAVQLSDVYMMFLFLSRQTPWDDSALRQWEHLLASFEPDHGPLPAVMADEAQDKDEDGDE